MKILDPSLIVKYDENASPALYILKDKTKLNKVFDRLPCGIINKNITGIGATTLEIGSPRHSIIVVPLKSIAYSKAKQHPNCKYVGGTTKYKRATSPSEIIKYHNKKNIEHKKYLVVADSLPKLMNALDEEAFNYFIMIDEIDSFQLDSGYRVSLENCLDYYKTFPEDKRALVSSTIMEFSDPELKSEKRCFFNYEKGTPRKINLYYSENVKGAAFDFILDLYNKNPEDKILVAYNTVDGCKAIATKLFEECQVPYEDIKILCSPTRKDDVPLFYDELENETLKGKINFMTSAYFVGVDINESYHSIAICNPEILHTLLSTNRLKQIAGRCREEALLSETIFFRSTNYSAEDQVPSEVLLESARNKIKAIDCIGSNFRHDQVLANQILAVRKLIVEKDDILGYNLVRVNINDQLVNAYFNTDACIDTMHTAKVLYSDSSALKAALLMESNDVNYDTIESSSRVSTKITVDKELLHEQINKALDAIRNLDNPSQIFTLINRSGTAIQSKIYTRYQQLHKYYENQEELLELLAELSIKNETSFKTLKNTIEFRYTETPFKRCVLDEFPVGSIHNSMEIKEKLNKALALAGMHTKIDTENAAVKKLKQFFNTKKDKRHLKSGLPAHKILGIQEPILNTKHNENSKVNVVVAED